ncbi:MAG: VWA domain-containing protein [PS1 clade bacterium]|uniref:VWA domain-containing protein n=1 Tax=PS1 clade bacterium TaxID=2175152 RepID=A0A937HIC0_9PROT|nr:VWA domain-containing protein [PS1 clade bacterium]
MIADFVRILRAADIRVSPAETLDAAEIFETIGFDDRSILKHALGQTLAKTEMEKQAFDEAFETYFRVPEETPPAALSDAMSEDDAGDEESGESETQSGSDEMSGEGQPQQAGEGGEGSEGGEGGEAANQTLTEMLQNRDMAALQAAMQQAASQAGIADAKLFTQQGMFSRRIMEAMGLADLDARIRQMNEGGETERAEQLKQGRAQLFEAVQDFVERQIAMRTKNAGRLLREDALSRIRLSNLDKSDMKIMRELIRKLAKRLASRHSRRRKKAQRGMLDIRRTMRANVAFDGNLFNLAWRRVKVERPKLIVLCDVSGSVAAVSRFFLMFLYSLDEVMPKTRSFVFSNRAGEISDILQNDDLEAAMEAALRQYGGGSTDYGVSMMDLAAATLDSVDKKTTVMVLGDARSNYGDPGHLVLKEFYERAGRVIFLNPEPESVWDTGDSEMKKLGAFCTHKQTCNSVKHLERVLDDLLRLSS